MENISPANSSPLFSGRRSPVYSRCCSKVCAVGTILFGVSVVQVLNTEAGILRVAVRLESLYSPALFLRDRTKFKVGRQQYSSRSEKRVAAFPVMSSYIKGSPGIEFLLSLFSFSLRKSSNIVVVMAPPSCRGRCERRDWVPYSVSRSSRECKASIYEATPKLKSR